jgi:DNA polymerase V
MTSQFIAHAGIFARKLLPLQLEKVSAGFPSPAQDYIEKTLDLNELCVRHPAATFYVRAAGESMRGVGIFPGDVLVVDKSLSAQHGDVVIAIIDGEFTVKELVLKPQPALRARNPAYPPIRLGQESQVEIFGVVTHAIRDFRANK